LINRRAGGILPVSAGGPYPLKYRAFFQNTQHGTPIAILPGVAAAVAHLLCND
jgi:hypothetical protein